LKKDLIAKGSLALQGKKISRNVRRETNTYGRKRYILLVLKRQKGGSGTEGVVADLQEKKKTPKRDRHVA